MVWTTKRRQSTVVRTQQLLTGIGYIRQQKQIPNIERLSRYMYREHSVNSSDTEKQLQYAVKDNLIISYTAVVTKGSKTGMEQEGFKIPDESEVTDDGHDWYCFECHNPGDVLSCDTCWRVYHMSCSNETPVGSKFICSECMSGRKHNKIKKKMLNILLGYTVIRLKEKTRELHKIGHREEEVNFQRFIYNSMDLNSMEIKVQKDKYRCLEEFQNDAMNVVHNIYLVYGEEHRMSELARIMIKDCKYDIDEIRQCWNCYHMSNSKPLNWFCEPCNPAHELVYAKQKGFSYWPAKVIRLVDGKYDVRFFGGYHQRALVPEVFIRPITVNIKSLGAKRTQGFVKACDELRVHQKLLSEVSFDATNSSIDGDDNESGDEMDDEMETRRVSSTSIIPPKKIARIKGEAPTPEDANMVTSSEDQVSFSKTVLCLCAETQTSPIVPNKISASTQTTQSDLPDTTTKCFCDEKYNKLFADFKLRLETDHKDEKDRALKELSDRLQKDFEEDKQQAVTRAMTNMQREIERVRQKTEEKCKEQYMEEMKKLAQKHKETISQTKKKQWCFNCEEEAMYHCCWNTSYCSIRCQQDHWHKEHKRVCRRRR